MTTEFTPDEAEEQLESQIDDAVPSHGYRKLPVLGIGASESALQQVQALLHALPAGSGLAVVLLRHEVPGEPGGTDWPGRLAEATPLRVVSPEAATELEPDTVYVLPPGRGARLLEGGLRLTGGEEEHGRMVIDLFLRSLADTRGAHSAAVVLSGPGADGAIGLKRVKERGGLTVAQDPDEAAQDAMPRAAIDTGMVDWILPVHEMANRLLAYFRLEPQIRLPREEGPQVPGRIGLQDEDAPLRDVLTLLRTRTGRDFAHYKRATIRSNWPPTRSAPAPSGCCRPAWRPGSESWPRPSAATAFRCRMRSASCCSPRAERGVGA